MKRAKSTDPTDRMGVYQSIGDVPDKHRLESFAVTFDGRGVWGEYVENKVSVDHPDATARFWRSVDRAGDTWKDHMADRGRHHALARPSDVATWVESLSEEYAPRTLYNHFWGRIDRFFRWMEQHTDYPHVYNPARIAVLESDTVRAVWDAKTTKPRYENE